MMKKLLNNKGESIIEVLVSLLIVSLCILMLQGSIITAAKINKKVENDITPFYIDGLTKEFDSVIITRGTSSYKQKVDGYKTSGGYYYYEYQK